MKPIVAQAAGALLLIAICQTAQAQGSLFSESGTSILADAFGTATGPEALPVSWSVVENASDIYTYTYVVNNPVGDVLLNNNGTPTTTPEIVDAFSVSFNTTFPGAYVPFSQVGGVSDQNNGTSGLFWSFTAVAAGSSSPALSFESDLPPILGDANAQDANPPSPWSSLPDGQKVPVPAAVPEATTCSLLARTALMFLALCPSIRKIIGGKAGALSW